MPRRPATAVLAAVAWAVLAAVAWAALASAAWAAPPRIDAPVTDLAGVLSAEAIADNGARLRAHRDATGVQMAVLVVSTTYGVPIEDYALEVAQAWGGGSADRNDGVLFVLAVDDRRMRLEIGYGLEPVLTDGESARILHAIKPMLRDGDYDSAVRSVTVAVIDETADLRPGEGIPLGYRLAAFFSGANYLLMFFYGVLLGMAPMALGWALTRYRRRLGRGKRFAALAAAYIVAYAVLPLLVALDNVGAWAWAPVLVWYGIPIGATLWLTRHPKAWKAIVPPILGGVLVGFLAFMVYWFLHRTPPVYEGTSGHETALFPVLIVTVIIGLPIVLTVTGAIIGGGSGSGYYSGGSYSGSSWSSSSSSSSSYSSSSSSYSSSSSSSSSSGYSGGGGSFGGGGASASW